MEDLILLLIFDFVRGYFGAGVAYAATGVAGGLLVILGYMGS
jgi:hypothetical protein